MDIGIDLGTTFSVIAVDGKVSLVPDYPGGEGQYLAECDVTIIPSPYGEATFPSVMIQDPDDPQRMLFGVDAVQKAEEGFAPVMFSKRKIGTKEEIPLATGTITAKDAARELLRHLKTCAEQALGRSVSRAIVTHPAYFDRGAVEETREAAREAGFDMSRPEQMLMEPVAAALSYTRTDKRDPLRILTYDLGGGTFDVTYLERREGVIDIRAFDGNHLLGGYNFDRELAHWIRERLAERGRQIKLDENDPQDRGRLARLLRLAESVKIKLAGAHTDTEMIDVRARDILVDTRGLPVQINERISREQFVKLIEAHLADVLECCKRTLAKARIQPTDLHEILLVGGSSYGPWVVESLKSAFPQASPKLFNPDLCVGAGAAIHAKMVLPPVVESAIYRVTLDVPTTSVLDTIHISGRVAEVDGGSPKDLLSAVLKAALGRAAQPMPLSSSGRFIFENVELLQEGPNAFTLQLTDANSVTVLNHAFQVTFAPEKSEASAVRTVLPRPLYIETYDGLVPLAEEGIALPAKCAVTLRRTNDNPHMTLRLFQEQDPVGEVRIENIPTEGGRGSLVNLEIEVTEKNLVRGTAVIRTVSGNVVLRRDVCIRFDSPEIASVEELRTQFAQLQARFLTLLLEDPDRAVEIGPIGMELMNNVEHVFQQQPVERQEVHVALRRLRSLLIPPKDEMKPTRHEFEETIGECRRAIEDRLQKAQKRMGEPKNETHNDLDAKIAQEARESVAHLTALAQHLQSLETDGLAAHSKKDRIAWARIYDAVTDIAARLKERAPQEERSTMEQKMFITFHILWEKEKLARRKQQIELEGGLGDWQGELDRIDRALDATLSEIEKIDDEADSEQSLAQIRLIYQRTIHPLEEAIKRLGADAEQVSSHPHVRTRGKKQGA